MAEQRKDSGSTPGPAEKQGGIQWVPLSPIDIGDRDVGVEMTPACNFEQWKLAAHHFVPILIIETCEAIREVHLNTSPYYKANAKGTQEVKNKPTKEQFIAAIARRIQAILTLAQVSTAGKTLCDLIKKMRLAANGYGTIYGGYEQESEHLFLLRPGDVENRHINSK